MPFELPSLPYGYDALEPFMSAQTLRVHHGVLQRNYVQNLNRLIRGTPYDHLPLEQLISDPPSDEIYENAAQAWNHNFFWYSMSSRGGGLPDPLSGFGQAVSMYGDIRQVFAKKASELFGSGWLWLAANPQGEVALWLGDDAQNPMRYGHRPLLCCDLWEHAYFLDYPGDRAQYVQAFLDHVVNWPFAQANYERAFGV